MPYLIEFASARVRRQLERLPEPAQGRIRARIYELANEPRPQGVAQLSTGVYRLRVGRYRVVYEVDDEAARVYIMAVAIRSEGTYRDLERLL